MKKIFTIVLLLLTFTNVKAYENDYFSLDIPNNYKQEVTSDNIYKWSNDNNYISVSISNNLEKKYNVEKYTEDDIKNQKKYIEDSINDNLVDFNFKVNVTNIVKKKYNNLYALNYNIYWPSKETTGYDMYQEGNVFTTNNYIITVIYNSDKKIENDETYSKMINSFKIKDEKIKKISLSKYLILIIISGTLLAVVSVIRSHKKNK